MDFVKKHHDILIIRQETTIVSYFDKSRSKTFKKIVTEATIQIGEQVYTSKFVVANCIYEISLVMSWHKSVNLITNYASKAVRVIEFTLPTCTDYDDKIKVTNLGNKKLKSVLLKKNKTLTTSQFPAS